LGAMVLESDSGILKACTAATSKLLADLVGKLINDIEKVKLDLLSQRKRLDELEFEAPKEEPNT